MRNKQFVEPRFAEMPEDELKEKASIELRNSPAIFALLSAMNAEFLAAYDSAASMEQVRELQGKRYICNTLLNIQDEVDRQNLSKNLTYEAIKDLDIG